MFRDPDGRKWTEDKHFLQLGLGAERSKAQDRFLNMFSELDYVTQHISLFGYPLNDFSLTADFLENIMNASSRIRSASRN